MTTNDMLPHDDAAIDRALEAWDMGADLRRRRERYKRYTYGDQWIDPETLPDGSALPSERLATERGQMPMTNNLIRRLIKTIVGYWRTQHSAGEAPYADTGLWAATNGIEELDARALEEFLISGCALQRVGTDDRGRVEVTLVSPDQLIINPYRDPLGRDIRLVGMLHDMPMSVVLERFGRGDSGRIGALRRLYGQTAALLPPSAATLGAPQRCVDTFASPVTRLPGAEMCRVVELWTHEMRVVGLCHRQEDATVRMVRPQGAPLTSVTHYWRHRMMAPDGTLLLDEPSRLPHGGHPFCVKMHPLTDGEVHPFVEDIIDQQRTVNRLITSIDSIVRHSAKGVLLFPAGQKMKGLTWNDICNRWAAADGVIPINGDPDVPMPTQVYTSGAGSDIYRLLEMQISLMDETSGVHDALLGRGAGAATGIEMYREQLRNSATALSDIFGSFSAFVEGRNRLCNLLDTPAS